MSIEVQDVFKSFGCHQALRGVSLKVETGSLVALLGPSGSGKTSLLRIIAGLERPDSGRVLFAGEDATRRDAKDRRVGFVFQHYALFRHLSVFENVAFGLRVRPRADRPAKAEISRRVGELLDLVQLGWMADRYPAQLSGGQRQRVALARALAVEPRVLLLDEPFGALDARVRQELRSWLRRLHDSIGLTSVFVTHDQEEALEVADRVAVLNEGQLIQEGRPSDIVDRPATPFVLDFVGTVNVFKGRVESGRAHLGPLEVDYPAHTQDQPRAAAGYVRAHDLDLDESGGGEGFWATLSHVSNAGAVLRFELSRPDTGEPLRVEIPRERAEGLPTARGARLFVRPRRVQVFVEDLAAP